jgi:Protein of unknown function (DUF2806)
MTTWLEFIQSIPGLAKAVTELIGDVGRVGSSGAKLAIAIIDQKSTAIEDDTQHDKAVSQAITEADVQITKAIAESAVQYVKSQGPVFGELALSHGIQRIIKKQVNLEAVVVKTIDNLKIAPPDKMPADQPSDDWLNLFGSYAENATSEKMREHWAHILAGEIKNPGSFSFITLHLASVLDEKLAAIIDEFRPWIISDTLPLIDPMGKDEAYGKVVTLAGIGFVSLGDHQSSIEPDGSGKNVVVSLEAGKVIVPPLEQFSVGSVTFHEKHSVGFPVAIITPAGRELLSALPDVPQTSELPSRLIAHLEQVGFKNVTFESKESTQDSAAII